MNKNWIAKLARDVEANIAKRQAIKYSEA